MQNQNHTHTWLNFFLRALYVYPHVNDLSIEIEYLLRIGQTIVTDQPTLLRWYQRAKQKYQSSKQQNHETFIPTNNPKIKQNLQ